MRHNSAREHDVQAGSLSPLGSGRPSATARTAPARFSIGQLGSSTAAVTLDLILIQMKAGKAGDVVHVPAGKPKELDGFKEVNESVDSKIVG